MFEYKLLPVPEPAKKAKGRKTLPERFAHALSELLNEQAKENWTFSSQEQFSLEEKSGLMGKEKPVNCQFLIFKREIALDAMPLDQKLEQLRQRKSETIVKAPAVAAPDPEPFPEPMASQTPFPEPIPSPSLEVPEETIETGEEPTRIFSPFDGNIVDPKTPPLGPAEKP